MVEYNGAAATLNDAEFSKNVANVVAAFHIFRFCLKIHIILELL